MKKNKRFFIEFLVVITLLVIAISQWVKTRSENIEIENNQGVCIGTVIDYRVVGTDNPYITFEYTVNNNQFKDTVQPDKLFKECEKSKWCIGKKYTVYYSLKSPEKGRIDLYKPH